MLRHVLFSIAVHACRETTDHPVRTRPRRSFLGGACNTRGRPEGNPRGVRGGARAGSGGDPRGGGARDWIWRTGAFQEIEMLVLHALICFIFHTAYFGRIKMMILVLITLYLYYIIFGRYFFQYVFVKIASIGLNCVKWDMRRFEDSIILKRKQWHMILNDLI